MLFLTKAVHPIQGLMPNGTGKSVRPSERGPRRFLGAKQETPAPSPRAHSLPACLISSGGPLAPELLVLQGGVVWAQRETNTGTFSSSSHGGTKGKSDKNVSEGKPRT